jgi:hypothetical protein
MESAAIIVVLRRQRAAGENQLPTGRGSGSCFDGAAGSGLPAGGCSDCLFIERNFELAGRWFSIAENIPFTTLNCPKYSGGRYGVFPYQNISMPPEVTLGM